MTLFYFRFSLTERWYYNAKPFIVKMEKILPWAIGIIIGWYFAENLVGKFFMTLGTGLANDLEGSFIKLINLN